MSALNFVLAFGAIWFLGALVLGHAGARRGGVLGIAADFAAGVVLLALVGSIGVMAGLRLSVAGIYALIGALAVGAAVRRVRLSVALAPPRDALTRVLLVAAASPLMLIGISALGDRLWWDGWAIWVLKARILFSDGTLPAEYFAKDGALVFSHPGYPLAVPLLDWWLFRHVGAPAPAAASVAGTIWHTILVGVVFGALLDRVGERLAALAALGTAAFWPIAFFAAGGTADVVVATALVGAIREMEDGVNHRDVAASWRAGVFLALGAMAKVEGIAIAAAVAGVGVLSLIRKRESRPSHLLAYALPFAVLAPWQLFVTVKGLGRTFFTLALTPAALLDRAALFLGSAASIVLQPAWLPIVALAVLGVSRRASAEGWIALGGYFVAVAASYLLTPDDPGWLVATSLERVLAACVPATLYVSLGGAAAPLVPEASRGVGPSTALVGAGPVSEGRSPDPSDHAADAEVGVEGHARSI